MSALDQSFARILDGEAGYAEILAFLADSVARMGEPEALAAGARAMRARMVPVHAPADAVDVCGTGGDGAHTLNISTAVAFVLAGADVTVAKHGNRAMSSKAGAADVLEALGVTLTGDVASLERCLAEAKVAFLFAQNHHPALRHVAAARREFGGRTIFNLLGPLSNPAGVKRQLVGVFGADYVEPVARALMLLGCERAWVVHGAGGVDELSALAPDANIVASISGSSLTLSQGIIDRELDPGLRGGDANLNAAALSALLDGAGRKSYRDAVLLNAAAALVVAGKANDVQGALPLAAQSLDSGAARTALERLVMISKAAP